MDLKINILLKCLRTHTRVHACVCVYKNLRKIIHENQDDFRDLRVKKWKIENRWIKQFPCLSKQIQKVIITPGHKEKHKGDPDVTCKTTT